MGASGFTRARPSSLRCVSDGNPAVADDLVSEAFTLARTARERVELPTVRGYLFAILRNLFLHDLRGRHRRVPLGESSTDDRPDPEVSEILGAADLDLTDDVAAEIESALPE